MTRDAGAYGTGPVKRKRRTAAEIEQLNEVLFGIVHQERPMTVRQVYYQAVARELVPKEEATGYRAVQRRLLKMRQDEVLPYSWITDNTRTVYGYERYRDRDDFARSVASLYRRDFWARSPVRVELWIEKDALSGVIRPIVVDEWGLDLHVPRGFSSTSYLWSAAEELKRDGRPAFIYLLTDFDPSGMSVASSIDRELRHHAGDLDVTVERIALTSEQVEQYQLPTRPAKKSDSRFKEFVKRFGHDCTDLDALPPTVLRRLVSEAIERHADRDELARLRLIERVERESIAQVFGSLS